MHVNCVFIFRSSLFMMAWIRFSASSKIYFFFFLLLLLVLVLVRSTFFAHARFSYRNTRILWNAQIFSILKKQQLCSQQQRQKSHETLCEMHMYQVYVCVKAMPKTIRCVRVCVRCLTIINPEQYTTDQVRLQAFVCYVNVSIPGCYFFFLLLLSQSHLTLFVVATTFLYIQHDCNFALKILYVMCSLCVCFYSFFSSFKKKKTHSQTHRERERVVFYFL